mmetsp:Transcript_228/g.454  ORF Transcript_228/g.454 Transcript_228/m.454 type:complete len:272 (+) Transcript_228:114-929(+)
MVVLAPRSVLLTNDDGTTDDTPFLAPWVQLFSTLGWRTYVCVPSHQHSWCAKSMTRYTPVKAVKLEPEDQTVAGWWHVNGTPATCVNVALHHLIKEEVDLVVSGPNLGHNAGRASVLSSGTVGAALEGSIQGKRSISISYCFMKKFLEFTPEELAEALKVSVKVVADVWSHWPEGVPLINVNVPLGIKATAPIYRTLLLEDSYESLYSQDPKSQDTFLHTGGIRPGAARLAPAGTDMHAVQSGAVSVTALYASLQDATKLLKDEFPFRPAP